MRLKQLWSVMMAATMVVPAVAQAQFVTYTSQSSFLDAIANSGVDTFDGFLVGEASKSPLARTAGAHSYTVTVTGGDDVYGVGTAGDPWLSVDFPTDALTFQSFSSGVAAVGGNFFGSNREGQFQSGNIMVTYVDVTGAQSQTLIAPTIDAFFGVVSLSGAITSFSVEAVQSSIDDEDLWPTVDNVTLGTLPISRVPEPATAVLLTSGLLVGMMARRRQR